jgi:hypothetical protein
MAGGIFLSPALHISSVIHVKSDGERSLLDAGGDSASAETDAGREGHWALGEAGQGRAGDERVWKEFLTDPGKDDVILSPTSPTAPSDYLDGTVHRRAPEQKYWFVSIPVRMV